MVTHHGHDAAHLPVPNADEPGAAAGPGATDTTAMPENVTSTEGEGQGEQEKPSASESSGSSQDAHDIEKGAEGETAEKKGESAGDNTPQRSKGKIAVIMLALMLAVFLAALDVTIITTALPTISEHFQSTAGYTWIGSAFLLANAASIPSWGKISDIFGRKPMLLLANIIFMVGSLVAALAYSIGMLIAARAVQGIGAGGLIILVNITIGDLFSLRQRGPFYGMVGAVWAVASAIGPVIGGAFTESVTWRWCFYINLPLDGLAFFILLFFLDIKTPRTPIMEGLKAIDWVGSLVVVGATLMFLFGLEYGGVTYPWDSATVICLIVFGVVAFGLFAFWEWKFAIFPVMPTRLFSKSTNVATLGIVFLHGFVFISASYYLPLYFQAILGATPILSGVYLLPTALALAFTSIGTGVFIGKVGYFLPPIYFGFFFMTLGFGLFTDIDASTGWAKIIIYQIVAGFGVGTLFQAPIIALQAHINPKDIGVATATLGFVRQIATSSSVVIGQVVFQNQMQTHQAELTRVLGPQLARQLGGGSAGANTDIIDSLPPDQRSVVRRNFANSLQPMWIMYTCFAALGLICCFLIKRKVLSQEHEETKTGLEAEKEHAAEVKAEDEAKRESKRQSKLERQSQRGLRDSKRGSRLSGFGSRPSSQAPTSRPTTSGSGTTADDRGSIPAMPPAPSSERVHDLEEQRRRQQSNTLSRLESGVAT